MKAHHSEAKRGGPIPSRVLMGALALFIVAVAFLGGSARQDMVQLSALYPIAALCLIPAFWQTKWRNVWEYGALCVVLALFLAWALLQIVPLPPEVWSSLPGRSAILALDAELSAESLWRPISMAPELSRAALFSMVVPVTALLFVAATKLRRSALLGLVALFGVINVLLGFAQLAAGGGSDLRVYRINSTGGPTGIFANENHSAAFLAVVLLVLARLIIWAIKAKRAGWQLYAGGFALGLTLLSILVHGSRSGIVMGLAASLAVLLMFWKSLPAFASNSRSGSSRAKVRMRKLQKWGRYAFGALGAAFISLIVVFLTMERVPGFTGLTEQDAATDLRWKLIDPLWAMAGEFWLLGTGFGSFAPAYMQFEPAELSLPSYVNQAHNDFLQLVIEGGLPAILLFLALVYFVGRSIFRIVKIDGFASALPIFWISVIGIVASASVIDYPVRTPIFQAVLIWLLCVLTLDAKVAVKDQGA